jgi:hypothetical protein
VSDGSQERADQAAADEHGRELSVSNFSG